MAKIKVHELAKELDRHSKEILGFLQEKGIEAKAAQSSVDETAAQLVRKAFGGGGSDSASQAEKSKSSAQEAAVKTEPAVKAPETQAAEGKEGQGVRNEEAKPAASEAPKKKKKIIVVSNPQNSKMNGGRTQQRTQGGRPQDNRRPDDRRQDNRRQDDRYRGGRPQAQAPVRPIKPLTPPSPTPSVQMVPPRNQQPRPQSAAVRPDSAAAGTQPAANAQEPVRQPAASRQPETARQPVNTQQPANTQQSANTQQPAGQQPVRQDARPQSQGGQYGSRPQGQSGQYGNRPQGQGGQYGNRSQGQGGGQYGNRPQGQGGGQYGSRPQGQSGQYGNRPQGQGGGQYGSRPQGQGGQYGNRPQGQGGQYGNRPQGQGGQYGNRPQGQGGQYGNRPQGQGGQYGNRPQGQGGQYQSRGGAAGDRPSYNRPNGAPGAGRGFAGGRDGRGNGGQGDRFRNQGGAKGFTPEAPAKDAEKNKRRFSQEKDKRSKKDMIYESEAAKAKPGRFIRPEKKEETVEEVIKVITLPETITIKELAEKMKMQPAAIIKKLFLQGKIVTVNQEVSYEEAENIAMEYDILCEKEVKVDVIEELLKEEEESEESMTVRPPVICVMGHVDHGKTSLLDAIRKTNVTDKEAGGITQHIGAYTVNAAGRRITFLDTPGHEAFTAMRMRGANATDIAILVVAADDGVMPQTVEAINHAKAAGIEIIVAVNKIDKPSANIDRVKQELAEYELIPEDWGGSTVFAPVSAKSGEGIEQLLEMILLTADILELKADPNRRARGLVIEAELDKGRGPVATVLVQKGTLTVGDFISAGASHGKVRAMIDDKGRRVKEAGPSTPVEILGLSDVPSAGEVFIAHENDKTAKSYAETYLAQNKVKMLEETKARMSLDDLFSQIKEGNLKELNLIVKADVQGSVEAVKQSLMKLSNEEVVVKCIHGGVGAINESDIMLAGASSAIIIGFNVRPDATAKTVAEREGVDVRLYKVIYQAIEDIEAAMKGMLDPVFEEKVIGHAEVRQIFKASSVGNIAGSYILDGEFVRDAKVRISREGKQIYEGKLASLKRFKDDVKEVKSGFECGLVFDGFDQMQEFDIVEAYIMVEVPR